jgi:hypothetical protein
LIRITYKDSTKMQNDIIFHLRNVYQLLIPYRITNNNTGQRIPFPPPLVFFIVIIPFILVLLDAYLLSAILILLGRDDEITGYIRIVVSIIATGVISYLNRRESILSFGEGTCVCTGAILIGIIWMPIGQILRWYVFNNNLHPLVNSLSGISVETLAIIFYIVILRGYLVPKWGQHPYEHSMRRLYIQFIDEVNAANVGRTPFDDLQHEWWEKVRDAILSFAPVYTCYQIRKKLSGNNASQVKNRNGLPILNFVVYYADYDDELIEIILAERGDVNYVDDNGVNVLCSAMIHNRRERVIRMLLNNSAKINEPVKDGPDKGKTPLHFAAKFHQKQLILLLLEYGADKTLRDDDGRTPLQTMLYLHERRKIERQERENDSDYDEDDDDVGDELIRELSELLDETKIISQVKVARNIG